MRRDDPSQFAIPITPRYGGRCGADRQAAHDEPGFAAVPTLSGLDDAQFYGSFGIVRDQAQWSRVMGPSAHHFPHDKLNTFMDIAGNEVPMLWLLQSRGYQLESLRKTETATERELRLVREENEALRRVLMGGGK
jgi:hypothetical protein